MPEKLNVIYNQMNKLASKNRNFQFMNELIPKSILDGENIPKMQDDLNLSEQI